MQFGLALLMIVAAIIVKLQVDYINKKDLGIAKDHIVFTHQDQKLTEKYDVLRNQLLTSNAIWHELTFDDTNERCMVMVMYSC